MNDLLTLTSEPGVDEVSRSLVFDILDDKCYEVICKTDGSFLVDVIYLTINTTRH